MKDFICSHYRSTDLGDIKLFLGLHITSDHSKKTLSIDQWYYIQNIVSCFDMLKCQPTYIPFTPSTKLISNTEKCSNSSLMIQYQQMVGSLMYAMLGTCPDICIAVNQLLQFGSDPTHDHLLAAQHVLQYLQTTQHFQLVYSMNNLTELVGYRDSDWAGDTDDCHSMYYWIHIHFRGRIHRFGNTKTMNCCTLIYRSRVLS